MLRPPLKPRKRVTAPAEHAAGYRPQEDVHRVPLWKGVLSPTLRARRPRHPCAGTLRVNRSAGEAPPGPSARSIHLREQVRVAPGHCVHRHGPLGFERPDRVAGARVGGQDDRDSRPLPRRHCLRGRGGKRSASGHRRGQVRKLRPLLRLVAHATAIAGQPAERTQAAMREAVDGLPAGTSSTGLPAAIAAIAWPSHASAWSPASPRATVRPRGCVRQVLRSPVGPRNSLCLPSSRALAQSRAIDATCRHLPLPRGEHRAAVDRCQRGPRALESGDGGIEVLRFSPATAGNSRAGSGASHAVARTSARRVSGPPALGRCPTWPSPPKGCTPTTAPTMFGSRRCCPRARAPRGNRSSSRGGCGCRR